MIVSLFDYGTGNLHSLAKALEVHGATVQIESEPAAVLDADAMVLPGVGAFGAAAGRLAEGRADIVDALAAGFPCLGICLGMQLLFESSEESPGNGLGFLAGQVRRLRAPRVPQMGWNDVQPLAEDGRFDPLFGSDGEGAVVYYANTFVAQPAAGERVIGHTVYAGDRFAAAVRKGNTWGVQFHPEKSAAAGLRMIGRFLAEVSQ
jgi:glutamine amidotransferase